MGSQGPEPPLEALSTSCCSNGRSLLPRSQGTTPVTQSRGGTGVSAWSASRSTSRLLWNTLRLPHDRPVGPPDLVPLLLYCFHWRLRPPLSDRDLGLDRHHIILHPLLHLAGGSLRIPRRARHPDRVVNIYERPETRLHDPHERPGGEVPRRALDQPVYERPDRIEIPNHPRRVRPPKRANDHPRRLLALHPLDPVEIPAIEIPEPDVPAVTIVLAYLDPEFVPQAPPDRARGSEIQEAEPDRLHVPAFLPRWRPPQEDRPIRGMEVPRLARSEHLPIAGHPCGHRELGLLEIAVHPATVRGDHALPERLGNVLGVTVPTRHPPPARPRRIIDRREDSILLPRVQIPLQDRVHMPKIEDVLDERPVLGVLRLDRFQGLFVRSRVPLVRLGEFDPLGPKVHGDLLRAPPIDRRDRGQRVFQVRLLRFVGHYEPGHPLSIDRHLSHLVRQHPEEGLIGVSIEGVRLRFLAEITPEPESREGIVLAVGLRDRFLDLPAPP